MSDTLRITGLSSGLDIDDMVSKIIKSEKMRIDPVKQQKQLIEWQKEAYRNISAELLSLKSSFFDVLSPTSDLRSSATLSAFKASVTVAGLASSIVTATATSGASPSSVSISEITSLATKEVWKSTAVVSDGLKATVNIGNVNTAVTAGSNTLTIALDGTSKTITLAGGYGTLGDLVADLDAKLGTAFGASGVHAVDNGGQLEITVAGSGHVLSATSGFSDLMTGLGLVNGDSNRLTVSKTLGEQFGIVADQTVTINGQNFTFSASTTISSMMTQINSSTANVRISYDELSDGFQMQSLKEGAINKVQLTDTSGFFAGSLKLTTADVGTGTDASFVMNGVATNRSSNTFMLNGVEFTLSGTHAAASGPITVNVTTSPEKVVATVKAFVEKYNALIDKINTLVKEEKFLDFKPLTDEQKKEMTETQITDWNSKAKSGVLKSDTLLRGIQSALRNSFAEMVDGVGMTLNDLGISGSTNYKSGGQIVLDETKLKTALNERPSEVTALFTQQSSVAYTDTANRQTRTSENGIAYRIFDILEDAIRTTRDSDGRKGTLLEKAGISKDASNELNELSRKILTYDTRIVDMITALNKKESFYYGMFGRMEAAIQRMNSQSAYLNSQFGG